jgi:phosphomannomutase / phosphoglucomutase
MTIPQHIFRQYDIRGLVANELTPQVAEAVGRAYAAAALQQETGSLQIAVGHDNRPSSPALQAALIRGLTESGVDVVNVGEVPTPLVYWAEKVLGTDGAIQITGSHNPPEWNGIKMTLRGASVYGDDILALRQRISDGAFVDGDGMSRVEVIVDRYISDVVGRFQLSRPLKVVADCGNGTGSLVAVELLEALGAEVVPLYCESDGSFPNHHPDPTVDEYVQDLIATVKSEGADLGVGFDGDADRIGVVDNTGAIIRGDILLLLFGLDILKRDGPGQKLVFDVKCSQVLPEVYGAAGGDPIMGMTGHSLMKEKMKEVGAPLAGELSGHICFADSYYGFDDALYDACRLIDLVARSPRTLSEMVADFPVMVSTPEIRIDVAEEEKFDVVDRALAHFQMTHEVIDVDGARVLFEGGWGLLRASNTQPVIVARFEAHTDEQLAAIRTEVEDWLRTQGVSVT